MLTTDECATLSNGQKRRAAHGVVAKGAAIIGGVLAAIGAVVLLWPAQTSRENWTPLEEHLQLVSGRAVDRAFETDRTGTYWVMLRIRLEGIQHDELRAVLGPSWFSWTSDQGPPLIPWTIESEGVTLAFGEGQGRQGRCYMGGDVVGVSLGAFEGGRGRRFRIRAEVAQTIARLRTVPTELVIQADPLYFKNAVVSDAIRQLIGLYGLLLPGCVLLLIVGVAALARRSAALVVLIGASLVPSPWQELLLTSLCGVE